MFRGIYTAANGMIAQSSVQDVIANNLANQTTPGFKRSTATLGAFPWQVVQLAGSRQARTGIGTGTLLDRTVVDWSAGELQAGSPSDAAILGDGFFAVQDASGGRLYTRAGSFHVSENDLLVDGSGRPVLGPSGAIRVISASQAGASSAGGIVRIGSDGTVHQGSNIIGAISVYRLGPNATITAADNGAFRVTGNVLPVSQVRLAAGSVERSNVDPVHAMTTLMATQRSYEGSRQAFQAEDAAARSAVTDLGKF